MVKRNRVLSLLTSLVFITSEIIPAYAADTIPEDPDSVIVAGDEAVITDNTAETDTQEGEDVPPDEPDWYLDYEYTLDGGEIRLHKYKGTSTVEDVLGTAVIDGVTYKTVLDPEKKEQSMWYNEGGNFYTNLTYLKIWDGVKTTEDASYLFSQCYTLTTLDVSGLDTSAATKTDYMFENLQNLEKLDVSMLDLSNVTSMEGMFSRMYVLSDFKFGDPDTSKVTNMNSAFGMSMVESFDISVLETSNVTDMGHMFDGCSSLTSLDLSALDTSKVTDMSYMFSTCRGLTSLDVSALDTSKVKDMSGMFYMCSGIKSLDLSAWDTSSVENMSFMFGEMEDLQNIKFGKFNTSAVTDMSGMFFMTALKSLDVSMFDTSKVTDMSNMFNEARALVKLDLKNFNTSSVKNMERMFEMCRELEEVNLSSFDTSSVENMSGMFFGCGDLTELDLNSFDTSNVTDMSSMFYSCGEYTDLNFDLKNFNTSKVENMEAMFRETSVKNIDLSFMDTSSAKNLSGMFYENKNLERIDISHFDTSKVENFSFMFYSCWSLKYVNLGKLDMKAASGNDGISCMFADCAALEEIDLSGLDVTGVKMMNNLFENCVSLKYLNLLKWDMSGAEADGFIANSAVKEIYLPVKAFSGSDPFYYYPEDKATNVLEKVYYAGTQEQWTALNNKMPEGVEIVYGYEGEGPQPAPYDDNGEFVRGVSIEASEDLYLYKGETRKLNAQIRPDTAKNKNVNWVSSEPSIVSIDDQGNIKALAVGSSKITVVTLDGGYTDSINVHVQADVAKIKLDKSSVKLPVDGGVELTATAYAADGSIMSEEELIWTSSDLTVAEVFDGYVHAVGKGKALISVRSLSEKAEAKCTVTVGDKVGSVIIKSDKGATSLQAGKTLQLSVNADPAGAVYESISFTSSDPSVATVSTKGLVTGISEGSVVITAAIDEMSGGVSAEIELSVTAAAKAKQVSVIEIRKGKQVLKHSEELEEGHADLEGAGCEAGKTFKLVAYGDGKKLSADDVVFSSSDEEKVSVNAKGKMKLLADTNGSPVTITATSLKNPEVKAFFTIAVRVPVKSIRFAAKKINVNKGSRGIAEIIFNPETPTDRKISWSAGDGVRLAVLHEGESIDELGEDRFASAVSGGIVTDPAAGEKLVYLAEKPAKKITITATSADGGKKAKCAMKVCGKVTSLELKTTKALTGAEGYYEVTLARGKSLTPKAVITAEYGADKTLSWSSNNEEIVSVSKKGKIKVSKQAEPGSEAVITAVTADGLHSVQINVTVK
ncbi:MAG: BspA family leucine-rich repeat surface protein [Lachnospiraceae bacterium]|nr:BspA family leucine-rich repeat surface protein [Lachnospiraceae bacterium]